MRDWERIVSTKRGVTRPIIKYKKELISQIDIIICEALATNKPSRMKELLNVLFELHLYRGSDELSAKIVEGLHHLALMAGLNSSKLSVLVAEKLWEMCFHYVGPDEVPMTNRGRQFVSSCINALGILGDFSSGYVRKTEVTKAFCENIWNFLEIACWYNRQDLARQVVSAVSDARKSCWHAGKLEFKTGDQLIIVLTRRMVKYVKSEKPSWKTTFSELQRIVRYGG